jgi:predicted site-specific integrase-resolvase
MTSKKPNVYPDGLYTQAQAARALGVDRHTIKRYTDSGLLQAKNRKADKRLVIKGTQILAVWGRLYTI